MNKITQVKVLDGYRLELTFGNGVRGGVRPLRFSRKRAFLGSGATIENFKRLKFQIREI